MSTNFDDTKWYSYTSSTNTMRTWTRLLKSEAEIPLEFQPAFPVHQDVFPYTLFIPEDRYSLFRKRNKSILCLLKDHFVFLELQRNEVKETSSTLADVLYLERGRILLHSWLKIVMPSGSIYLQFNTTNDDLFKPIIEKFRQKMCCADPDKIDIVDKNVNRSNLSYFDYLNRINFKYMNYGKRSIRADDTVIGVAYQPVRNIQELNIFNRKVFRRQATDHLLILTDSEIILIKESKRIKSDKNKLYGGVFTYIPRRQINNVGFDSDPASSECIVDISLADGHSLTSEFSAENEELRDLLKVLG